MSITKQLLFFILAAGSVFFSLPAVAQDSAQTVHRIDLKFQGPPAEAAQAKQAVLNQMKTAEGRPFSQNVLDSDMRRITTSGPYEASSWIQNLPDGGVRVVVMIRKRYLVKEIVFDPEPPTISTDDVLAEMTTEQGSYLIDRVFVKDDTRRLREALVEAGYYFADVTTEIIDVTGGIKVVFKAEAGPCVYVRDVKFLGNKFYTDSELYGCMYTYKLNAGLPVLTTLAFWRDYAFIEERIKTDIERIARAYHDSGFLDAHVSLEKKEFSDDLSNVTLTMRVHEGKRYTVRSVKFNGNKLFSDDILTSKVTLKIGGPLLGAELRSTKKKIREIYDRAAFINARIRVLPDFGPEGSEVNLIFNIKEGEKVYIERIDFKGNTKTRSDVIRRELSIHPGEPLDKVELSESLSRLFRRGYFNRIFPVTRDGSRENWKRLLLEVSERPTGSFIFGMAFSSEMGAQGHFMFQQSNFDLSKTPSSFGDLFSESAFAGGGQRLSINFRPGFQATNFRIFFNNPYFLDTNMDFSTTFFGNNRRWRDYSEDRSGISLGLGQRIDKDYILSVTFKLSDIAIYGLSNSAPSTVLRSEGNTLLTSLAPSARINKRKVDRRGTPYAGYDVGATYELASGLFGGDISFGKITLAGNAYNNIFEGSQGEKYVLRLGANARWVNEMADTDYVPVFELGFLGGTSTLRGFQFRQVGPREDGHATGGQVLTTATAEFSIPFPGAENNFRIVFFNDYGNLAHDWDTYNWDEFRSSVGWGLRIRVGPSAAAPTLRLDFGYPVRKLPGDERRTFYFSFSSQF